MRKSLWIFPMLLLSAAISPPAARADTIVTSGGNVTGINGITIAGTTYNVTWGMVIDNTFAASLTNATLMNNAITADLTAFDALAVADINTNITTVTVVGVAAPGGAVLLSNTPFVPGSWVAGTSTVAGFTTNVTNAPTGFAWDEFAVVATPEPSSAGLMLLGLGLVLLLRKRNSRGHQLAT